MNMLVNGVCRFKQRSLATHPTRNPNDLTVNTARFRDICEAFDVLSQGKQIVMS